MSEKYNQTAERLWEKIEFHKDKFIMDCVDLKKSFPIDQFSDKNPLVKNLIREVEEEFSYKMSERQSSWSVIMATGHGNCTMNEYNKANGLKLSVKK